VSFFVPAESWDMFKQIAIITGSILLAIAVVGVAYLYFTGGTNPQTASDMLNKTAYLAKSSESYARCYNSINYGTSLIGDVRLQILSDNFYDKSITSDRLDIIQNSFMESVKQKCQKTVDDYQQAYDGATKDKEEINSSENALWNFLFGFTRNRSTTQDLSTYAPARARMTIPFNDYVFTQEQVQDYFKEQLGL
jgi:hypothetical protein